MKATAQGGLTVRDVERISSRCSFCKGNADICLNSSAHGAGERDCLLGLMRDLALQSLESVRSEALPRTDTFSNPSTEGDDDLYVTIENYNALLEHAYQLERALSPARVAEGDPSADEVPHFWMGHRDKEPSTEEIMRVSDALVQAVTEDYWKDGVVQWPERFLHTKECNVHEPTLSLCSCGLETRLKDEILRLQRRAPESPARVAEGLPRGIAEDILEHEYRKREGLTLPESPAKEQPVPELREALDYPPELQTAIRVLKAPAKEQPGEPT